MKPAWMLESWLPARRSAVAWRTVVEGAEDEAAIVRAAAHALALRAPPAEVATRLIEEGEFYAVGLLLADGAFADLTDPAEAIRLEAENESARQLHLSSLGARLTTLQERARRIDAPLDLESILASAGSSKASDLATIQEHEERIVRAEADRLAQLRARLVERTAAQPATPMLEAWRSNVEMAISHGAIPAAEAALVAGPDADVGPTFVVPAPPIWPYRREPLQRILEWFDREGQIPAGFDPYRPPSDDASARAFVDALRDPSPDLRRVLESLATVLGTSVLRFQPHSSGLVGFLADLSAPGFHALGKVKWPDGVPMLLMTDERASDPEIPAGEILIRLVRGRGLTRHEGVLHLDVNDVLAVLHDKARRDRLLSQLGRQLPLGLAFDARRADGSVSWARSDLPELVVPGQTTLLVGAPGMGKTIVLDELAGQHGAVRVDARRDEELPQDGVLLIDGLDGLDEARAHRLAERVAAIAARTPFPGMVIAARPESRERLKGVGGALREVFLRPRSLSALTEQATTMLAWVGIEASDPGSYCRTALLCGGNPTVLFYLCDALANVLAAQRKDRRFTAEDLERAWQSPRLRSEVRRLLWEPIASRKCMMEAARAVAEFAASGTLTPKEDLFYVGNISGEEAVQLADGCLQLLAAYGLVTLKGNDVCQALGGPAFLMAEWVA